MRFQKCQHITGNKKKVRFRLYCSLVVILIISSTCIWTCLILSLLVFCSRCTALSLHLLILTYVCPRTLKLESTCFKPIHLAHFLLMVALLPYDTFAQNKLLLFWFLIRLDCGLWLFPRSEQLFSILSERLSDSLLIKNREKLHSTEMFCPNQFADPPMLMK